MKTAATQFLREKANRALFQNYRTFTLTKTPGANPPADPRSRQGSENPTPGATRMCESPGVARGEGWSGLELTDT